MLTISERTSALKELTAAAERGDLGAVKDRIKHLEDNSLAHDVGSRDDEGFTALMRAAKAGHSDIVRLLLEKDVDVHALNFEERPALFFAADTDKTDVAKLLIDKGADVDLKDDEGMTALILAARNGNVELARLLLDKGANVNWTSKKQNTALRLAAFNGRTDVAKLLLARGAEVDAKDALGRNALFTAAAWNENAELVRLLIENGASVNVREDRSGDSALMWAARKGYVESARLLIQHGADTDVAIAGLEKCAESRPDDAAVCRSGIKMIKRLEAKNEAAGQPQLSSGISKEELKSIMHAAVESSKPQKEGKKPGVKTDIDSPSFSPSQTIMGEEDLAVVIGIEGYQNVPKSDYSYDDAKSMKDYVKSLGFKERNIEFLADEKATKSAIDKITKTWLVNKVKPASRVFVYYSGHGSPDPKTGDAYILPYDGDPNYLSDTGIPLKSLYASLGKLPAAEIVVVLDACFSGTGGRSVLAKGARPLVMVAQAPAIPANMVVLSATRGTQISTSSPEKGHGVFTYYFLKGLKEGKTTVADIYEYMKTLVEDEAKTLNVQQSPSMSPETGASRGRFALRR